VPRKGQDHAPRRATAKAKPAGPAADPAPAQRLDKWLWFARFAKTRTLAARLVEDGKVRVNREKILKPAQTVRAGDVITAAVGGRVRVVKIADAGVRRGPAEEARGLYDDLTPPQEPNGSNPGATPPPARATGTGRPTKRERRQLDAARAQARSATSD